MTTVWYRQPFKVMGMVMRYCLCPLTRKFWWGCWVCWVCGNHCIGTSVLANMVAFPEKKLIHTYTQYPQMDVTTDTWATLGEKHCTCAIQSAVILRVYISNTQWVYVMWLFIKACFHFLNHITSKNKSMSPYPLYVSVSSERWTLDFSKLWKHGSKDQTFLCDGSVIKHILVSFPCSQCGSQ